MKNMLATGLNKLTPLSSQLHLHLEPGRDFVKGFGSKLIFDCGQATLGSLKRTVTGRWLNNRWKRRPITSVTSHAFGFVQDLNSSLRRSLQRSLLLRSLRRIFHGGLAIPLIPTGVSGAFQSQHKFNR